MKAKDDSKLEVVINSDCWAETVDEAFVSVTYNGWQYSTVRVNEKTAKMLILELARYYNFNLETLEE